MNNHFLSVKNISLLIVLLIIALFLTPLPCFGRKTYMIPSLILIGLSIIAFFKFRNNITVQCIAVSMILSKIVPAIIPGIYELPGNYYDESKFREDGFPISYFFSFLFSFVCVVAPIVYAIYKNTRNKNVKRDLIIMSVAICIPNIVILLTFLSPVIRDLDFVYNSTCFYFIAITLCVFFYKCKSETNNKHIRIAAYIAFFGAILFLLYSLLGIIMNYGFREYLSIPYFVVWPFVYGSPLIIVSCIAMGGYFIYILKIANFKVKVPCIGAFIGLVSLGIIYYYVNKITNIEFVLDPYGAFKGAHDLFTIYTIVYSILAYSFYKFYKLF